MVECSCAVEIHLLSDVILHTDAAARRARAAQTVISSLRRGRLGAQRARRFPLCRPGVLLRVPSVV